MGNSKRISAFWILVLFFLLFSVWQLWIPEALDDWRWGSEVGIARLKMWFEGYNGRYFGNIVVIVLTRMPIVVRSMMISGVMTMLLWLIYQLVDREKTSFIICMFFVICIPTDLMAQTYGWVSGFSNFCVSTAMILGFLYYHFTILRQKEPKKSATVISLLNAFLGTLVLENSTVYLIILSIAFLIIYGMQFRRLHKGILLHFLIVCIGAIWMFSNSAYRLAVNHASKGTGKEIQAFELSINWFLSALKAYTDTIVDYWIMSNSLLNIVTCIIIIFLALGYKKRGQTIFTSLFSGFGAFYLFDMVNPIWKQAVSWGNLMQAVIVTSYCLLLVVFTGWFVRCHDQKIYMMIVLWSQLFLMGPLIIAYPIAIRCFYSTYIFFVLYLGMLVSYAATPSHIMKKKNYVRNTLLIGIFCFIIGNTGMYYILHKQVKGRLQYIYKEVKKGKKEITLKEIPLGNLYGYGLDVYHPAWVDRYKMYYGIPKEVVIKFPEKSKAK